MSRHRVAWIYLDDRTGAPGEWTKTHLTDGDGKTLCGRKVPTDAFEVGPYGYGSCIRCRRADINHVVQVVLAE